MQHSQIYRHEITFFDITLQRFRLSVAVLFEMFKHRSTHLFLFLVCLLMFTVDPHGFRVAMPIWQASVMWPISVYFYVVCIFGLIYGLASIQLLFGKFLVLEPLASTLPFLIAFFETQALAEWFSDGEFKQFSMQYLPFLFLGVMCLQLIFIRFVMPQLRPVETPTLDLGQAAKVLAFGDMRLLVSTLRYMVSDEHYVRITTQHETIVHRVRLRDLVAQLEPIAGIQPHRSWWVGTVAQPYLDLTNNKPQLILIDGAIAPVAKARMEAVEKWLDLNADDAPTRNSIV